MTQLLEPPTVTDERVGPVADGFTGYDESPGLLGLPPTLPATLPTGLTGAYVHATTPEPRAATADRGLLREAAILLLSLALAVALGAVVTAMGIAFTV